MTKLLWSIYTIYVLTTLARTRSLLDKSISRLTMYTADDICFQNVQMRHNKTQAHGLQTYGESLYETLHKSSAYDPMASRCF
jgi:hypothetical protein